MEENIAHEKELLCKIALGDQHAFGLLFRSHSTTIYLTALRLTQSPAVSEEIVQDVFMKVWLRRTSLPRILQFKAWLFTIAQNTIYSAMRKRYRELTIQRSINAASSLPQPAEDQNTGYEQLLEEAVDHLPSKQKNTYILIKKEGLKRQEAASILNVSAETVKSNLEQAIRNIKAYCISKKEAT
ncbi:MAG: RNA polymerase sigma factor [Bacteroidetes bacterium]|nr:RNA polymerase sigma factor [Bacteroidota bacterium]